MASNPPNRPSNTGHDRHRVHFSSRSDEYATPDEAFQYLAQRYGPFDLDTAATAANAKCARYFDRDDDALTQPWNARSAWGNWPYSKIEPFTQHAIREVQSGRCQQLTLLLPARTCTRWFRELVEHAAEPPLFLSGRLRFGDAAQPAPFPSFVVVLRRPETWTAADPAVTYSMPKRHGTRPRWYTIRPAPQPVSLATLRDCFPEDYPPRRGNR